MRLTTHNGRTGRDGAYLASHNDRQFPTDRAEHIDQKRSEGNVYWNVYQDIITGDFTNAEERFYREHFSRALRDKNNRYQAQRHPERVQTMDEYYKNPRTCPEESIFQIGSIKDGTINGKDLLTIYKDFKAWREENFPAVHVLDYALHVDEQGAPHIHERVVWVGHDRDGNEIVSQNGALKEMGVDRPRPHEPQGRYNNPKQLYTSICREQALSICRAHGLELETQPRERSQSGLTQIEYKARQEEKKLDKIKGAKTYARERATRAREQAEQQYAENSRLRAIEGKIRSDMEREKITARQLAEMNEKARKKLQRTQKQLEQLEHLKGYLSRAEQRELQEQLEQKWDEPEWD